MFLPYLSCFNLYIYIENNTIRYCSLKVQTMILWYDIKLTFILYIYDIHNYFSFKYYYAYNYLCRPFALVDGRGFQALAQRMIALGAKYGNIALDGERTSMLSNGVSSSIECR